MKTSRSASPGSATPSAFSGLAVALGLLVPPALHAQSWPAESLTLHLDAAVGVTDAGQGRVSEWADQSTRGNTLAQTDPGRRPRLVPGALNGRPVVEFREQWLSRPNVPGANLFSASATTVFFVQRQLGSDPYTTTLSWVAPEDHRWMMHATHSDNLALQVGRPGAGGSVGVTQPPGWDDAWHLVTLRRDGANGWIRVDGMEIAQGLRFTSEGDPTRTATLILASDPWGNTFNGEIAEVLGFSAALTDAQVRAVESELLSRWNLPGAAAAIPDLLVRNEAEPAGAFSGDDVYQQEPATPQLREQAVEPLASARYRVRIQNEGLQAHPVQLRAAEGTGSGWTVVYRAGETDITDSIAGPSGWRTPAIDARGHLEITVEIRQASAMPAGHVKSVRLEVRDTLLPNLVRDVVGLRAVAAPVAIADLMIARAEDPAWTGDGVRNLTAERQTRWADLTPGTPATFTAVLGNDGNASAPFRVTGTAGDANWTARYEASQGVVLDGTDDFVDLGAWAPVREWSVEARVAPSALPGGRRTIAGSAAQCRDWGILLLDGKFAVAVQPPGGCWAAYSAPEKAVVGRWYNVAAVCDGTEAVLYVDGVEVAHGPVANYAPTANGTRIGGEVCCGGYFPGAVDEVRIWSRALSLVEVIDFAATPPSPDAEGLAGYWQLNDGVAGIARDLSPNGRHGLLANGAAWQYADVTDAITGTGLGGQSVARGGTVELRMTLTPAAGIPAGSTREFLLRAGPDGGAATDAVRLVARIPGGGAVPVAASFTSTADFERGLSSGVDASTVADRLQLAARGSVLPYLWVPNSGDHSVSKIDTRTGRELGRYRVAPAGVNGNPSRTTVDLRGNCWVANRNSSTVVKVGLLELGGFIDRNGDGVIQTSRDLNGDGSITGAEMLDWGQDECVLHEVVLIPGREGRHVPGTYLGGYVDNYWNPGPRGLAVDASGNLWAGTHDTMRYHYIDGETGTILRTVDVSSVPHTAYGAAIDQRGQLWSSGYREGTPQTLLRLDTVTGEFQGITLDFNPYGLALDGRGHLFVSAHQQSILTRWNTTTAQREWSVPIESNGRGVAVTEDGDVWVVSTSARILGRYSNAGVRKASIPIGPGPTGVAVDAAGKLWVMGDGDEWLRRIDPVTESVDLVKRVAGAHYGYSDMTGNLARFSTLRLGTWSMIHDSLAAKTAWGRVTWHAEDPTGTNVVIRVRSSEDRVRWSPWETAANGRALATTSPGRFLEFEVTLRHPEGAPAPALLDLAAEAKGPAVADVGVRLQATPNPVASEYPQRVSVLLTNHSPDWAGVVEVVVDIPSTSDVLGVSVPGGFHSRNGNRFTCTVAGVGPLSQSVITFDTAPLAPGTGRVEATATPAAGDPNPSNNSALLDVVSTPVPCAAPSPGMISWWTGDEHPLDSVGGRDFTAAGGPTFGPGKVDRGFVFDSNDDRLTVPHDPAFDMAGTGFTAQFWVKGTQDQPGRASDLVTLLDKSHGWVDSTGWTFQITPANGVISFGAGLGGGGSSSFTGVASLVNVLDGRWHHVAATWDRFQIRLYVDGAHQGFAPLLVPVMNTRPFNVGFAWGNGSPQRFFRGSIDEILLHNRGLSETEIAAAFAARSGGLCKSGLVVNQPVALDDATLGRAVAVDIRAALGQPPYTYEFASGTLPNGVSLNPSGALAGTPRTPGSFPFTVRARDASGATATRSYVLNVLECVERPEDLAGYWTADGHAEDEAGAAHGVLEYNAGYAPGRVGRAFVLDGTDDAVRIPSSASGPFDITGNQLSLVAWVNAAATNPPAHGYRLIIDKYWDGSATGYDLALNVGSLEWHVATVNNRSFVLRVPDFPLQRWVHVAATYNGEVARIYLDGVEFASADLTGNIVHNNHDLTIGNDNWPGSRGYAFNGFIDDVRILRRGLTESEVIRLRDSGGAGECEFPWADLALKSAAEPDAAYSGDDLYLATPDARQARSLATPPNQPAAYDVRIQNDSLETRAFALKVAEGTAPDWIATYRANGVEISQAIRSSGGYLTPVLDPGTSLIVRVEVTPGFTVAGGANHSITLRAHRDANAPVIRDLVRLDTVCAPTRRPDLMVRRLADAQYAGEGFWNADATGQSSLVEAEPGRTAEFEVLLRNLGNVADRIRLDTVLPGSGWTADVCASLPHLILEGAGQHVRIDDHPRLRPASVTVEGWFQFSAVGGVRVMFAKPLGNGGEDSFVLWHDGGSLRASAARIGEVTHGWAPSPGTWYHLALSFDDTTKRLALFIGGTEVAGRVFSGSLVYDGRPGVIGADIENGNPAFFLGGRAAEVRLWSQARTEAQLRSNLNRRVEAGEAGLAACWRLDDGIGDLAADSGSGGLTGTLVGLPTWGVGPVAPGAECLDVTEDFALIGDLTLTLPPKAMWLARVRLSPDAGAVPGVISEARVTATSLGNPALLDSVRLAVTVPRTGGTPTAVTYTTDEDFSRGRLSGVDYTTVPGQLQLAERSAALNFLWVPNNEGSISKVDTLTGRELGRYRTCPTTVNGQPSRTTVDLFGNCYVANRHAGTVVKVGLLENGQYVDRNGDGLIQTSRDANNNGEIEASEMLPWGQDECVLWELCIIPGSEGSYVPGSPASAALPYRNDWGNPGPRGVAIDADGNLWLGTMDTRKVYHVDGQTGAILRTVDAASANAHRSYGAVLDRNGVYWAASHDRNHLYRLDPATGEQRAIPLGHFSYGINVDRNGKIFVSGWQSSRLSRIDAATGTIDWSIPAEYEGRGIAITDDGDVWIAHSGPGVVVRRSNDGVFKASIPAGNQPTGVAVDSRGMVWVVGLGDDFIRRIDPTRNVVDLTRRIATVNSGGHYGYSDMTGNVARNSTTRIGFWNLRHDSGRAATPWGAADWDAATPEGTSLRLRVRSSDDGVTWSLWESAERNRAFHATPPGRYLEAEVTFQSRTPGVTPVLRSLTLRPSSEVDYGVLVYSGAFDQPPGTEWSANRTAVTPAGNRAYLGPFGNETVTLTLPALPAHVAVTVLCDQFVLGTWDGNSTEGGPDRWSLDVAGGLRLVDTTFNNGPQGTAAAGQSYPGDFPAAQNPARTGAQENNTLGFQVPGEGPMDAVYRHVESFPHTAQTLVLNFRGQGLSGLLTDEGWGLDNVRVYVTPPEPRPELVPVGIVEGGFLFRVAVQAGRTYRIEASENLVQWELLRMESPVTSPLEVLDPDVFTRPHRFFRVIRQ